MKQFFTTSAA